MSFIFLSGTFSFFYNIFLYHKGYNYIMVSHFLGLFGDIQTIEVLDFLIENQAFEYSVEEIAFVLNYSNLSIEDEIKHLNSFGLLLIENEKIQLDPQNKIIKHLIEVDSILTRDAAEKL